MAWKCKGCGLVLDIPAPLIGKGTRFGCVCGREASTDEGYATTRNVLSAAETADLFPGETDPTLLGNRIAALTEAIGLPACGGCHRRKNWLNRAHAWLRAATG
jgi:hypothetical protein